MTASPLPALGPLAPLAPAARARVIMAAAMQENQRLLWQAALGQQGQAPALAQPGRAGGQLAALGAATSGLAAPGEALVPWLRDQLGAAAGPCGCAPPAPLAAPSPPPLPTMRPTGQAAGGLNPAAMGPNAIHIPALEAAASRTGIPAAALAAIVDAEAAKEADGGWRLTSRNPRSSAAGLGQFLAGTWLGLAQTPGSTLNAAARGNGWLDAAGRVLPAARTALLALRFDGPTSIAAVADYAAGNLRRLGQWPGAGGAGADPTALARAAYLAHHLGPGDAARMLRGGLDDGRARTLLAAQIGAPAAAARINQAANPAAAHRQWLDSYIARTINPARYLAS